MDLGNVLCLPYSERERLTESLAMDVVGPIHGRSHTIALTADGVTVTFQPMGLSQECFSRACLQRKGNLDGDDLFWQAEPI